MAILEAAQLWKQYRLGEHAVSALTGVDVAIERGDFAIMAPSGSGKSTLLHLLGGLDRLNDDQATLARRHNVGFVFQFYRLLPALTAEENITLSLIIDGQNPAKFREHVDALVDLVGLADRRHHKPDQLSVASSSGWQSHAHWSPNPLSSWPMNLRATWIPEPVSPSWSSCAARATSCTRRSLLLPTTRVPPSMRTAWCFSGMAGFTMASPSTPSRTWASACTW